ncbi:MAG: DUF736 domain-containing protein [Beijerinckiaceae bacterium]
MATIGTFTSSNDGLLSGAIKTLTLDTQVSMEPIDSGKDGSPSYRIFAGNIELGAAWRKTAKESGREYHQVRLDDPSFPSPVFANLIENDTGGFDLLWHRPRKMAAKSRQGGQGYRRR